MSQQPLLMPLSFSLPPSKERFSPIWRSRASIDARKRKVFSKKNTAPYFPKKQIKVEQKGRTKNDCLVNRVSASRCRGFVPGPDFLERKIHSHRDSFLSLYSFPLHLFKLLDFISFLFSFFGNSRRGNSQLRLQQEVELFPERDRCISRKAPVKKLEYFLRRAGEGRCLTFYGFPHILPDA